jgi:porphobilinogen deaminase
MTIVNVGVSHRIVPAEVLEKLAVPSAELGGVLGQLHALAELATEAGAEPAVRVSGVIAAPDGSSVIRAQTTGPAGDGDALGRCLAHMLLTHGGAALLGRTSLKVTDPRPHPHGRQQVGCRP